MEYRVELLWADRLQEEMNAIAGEGWVLHTLQGDFRETEDGWSAWKFLTVWQRVYEPGSPHHRG